MRRSRIAAAALALTGIAAVGLSGADGAPDGAFGAGYQAGSAADKQIALFRAVSAAPYTTLPKLGSAGVGETFKDTASALRLKLLGKTFAEDADVREPRTKIFHPFGSVALVKFEPALSAPTAGLAKGLGGTAQAQALAPAHPFTGLFRSGALGLARLSLATDDDSYIPGIGLKLFVDGKPSVNTHAIPSFDSQSSRDFFERAPSNTIPTPSNFVIKLLTKLFARIADPLHRSVDKLATVESNGCAVASPRAPRDITFRPAAVHFDGKSKADFRDQLAALPVGTVIYDVWGREAGAKESVLIGSIRTTSRFVASSFGDRELHFLHAK